MRQQQLDLYYYLDAAQRRKTLLIIPILLFTVVGVILAVKLPSYYRSTTVILVEKQQVPEAYVTPTDKTPFNDRLNTLRQQILSKQKLEKIINDYRLYQNDQSTGVFNAVLNGLGITAKNKSKEEMLERMISDIEAKVIGGSSGEAFSISYVWTNPNTTMQVTNTLASLFIEENLKAREQYAEGTADFIVHELENAKKELETQEKAVRNFKEKYMGSLPQELDSNLRTLDRLQMELQSLVVELKSVEDRKILLEAQLNQQVTVPGTPAAHNAPTNPLVDELQRLQHELAGLLSIYNENYPDVVIAKKRINEIKGLITKPESKKEDKGTNEFVEINPEVRNPEIYNNLVTVKSNIARLQQREADLRKQIKRFERRVEEIPANEQRLSDLRRDYDVSLRNYQTLLEKKFNAKLSENLEKRQKGERFTIVDPANLPERPFKPNRPMVVTAAFLAGAGAGVGLIIIFEFLNPAFRKPEDFEGILQIKVLSTIPEFSRAPSAHPTKG